jgi:hypothetical protein
MKPHIGTHSNCLIRCQSNHCNASTCCSRNDLDDDQQHTKPLFSKKFGSKEIIPSPSGIDLTKFTMKVTEVNDTSCRFNETQPPSNLKQISACDMTVVVSGKDAKDFRTVNVDVVKSTTAATLDEGATITECSDDGSGREKENS